MSAQLSTPSRPSSLVGRRFVRLLVLLGSFAPLVAWTDSAGPPPSQDDAADCAAPVQLDALKQTIDRLSDEAKAKWPSIKARYLTGLPEAESLYVTMLVANDRGKGEYLFIAVDQIREGQIRGHVSNDVELIQDLHQGAPIELPEDAITDWVITKPDGSEEGNSIGKYIDTLEQCRLKRDSQRVPV